MPDVAVSWERELETRDRILVDREHRLLSVREELSRHIGQGSVVDPEDHRRAAASEVDVTPAPPELEHLARVARLERDRDLGPVDPVVLELPRLVDELVGSQEVEIVEETPNALRICGLLDRCDDPPLAPFSRFGHRLLVAAALPPELDEEDPVLPNPQPRDVVGGEVGDPLVAECAKTGAERRDPPVGHREHPVLPLDTYVARRAQGSLPPEVEGARLAPLQNDHEPGRLVREPEGRQVARIVDHRLRGKLRQGREDPRDGSRVRGVVERLLEPPAVRVVGIAGEARRPVPPERKLECGHRLGLELEDPLRGSLRLLALLRAAHLDPPDVGSEQEGHERERSRRAHVHGRRLPPIKSAAATRRRSREARSPPGTRRAPRTGSC